MAKDDNVLIAYVDYMLYSGTVVTSTSANWETNLPVTNIISNTYNNLGRNTDLIFDISIDFGVVRPSKVVAIPKHSFSDDATWRIRASNNALLLTSPSTVPSNDILYDNSPASISTTSTSTVNTDDASGTFVVADNVYFHPSTIIQLVDGANTLDATVDSYDAPAKTVTYTKTGTSGSYTGSSWAVSRSAGYERIWPSSFTFGELQWGAFQWDGTEELFSTESYVPRPPAIRILPTEITARYWNISIEETDGTQTFVDINKLLIGPAWQPSHNMDVAWSVLHVDKSKKSFSRAAQLFVDSKPQYRKFSISFNNLDTDELMKNLGEIDRQIGTESPLLLALSPSDTTNLYVLSVYGNQPSLTPMAELVKEFSKKSLIIEEWI